jgi:very-short-patch-repair endonuclease
MDEAHTGPDFLCAQIARRQFGVIRLDQIRAAGLSPGQVEHRCRRAGWSRILPGVLALPGAPDIWATRVHATHHWAGNDTAFSGITAGVLLGIDELEPRGQVEIVAPRCLPSKASWLVVHRVEGLDVRDVMNVHGLRVTTPARTLLGLAAALPRRTVRRALTHLLHEHLITVPLLRQELERIGKRGRKGTAFMRKLLSELGDEPGRAENAFEVKLFALIRGAGFPLPEQQFEIWHNGGFIARADLAYPERKLIIEADSYRWHSDPEDWRRDQVRHNLLSALGWTILRFTWRDLGDPSDFLHNLRRAYERASA